jgi:hypothetical protein
MIRIAITPTHLAAMKPTTRRGNPATVAAWTSSDWLNWGQMNEGERRLREAIAEVGRAASGNLTARVRGRD